jgi:hypothetical protein
MEKIQLAPSTHSRSLAYRRSDEAPSETKSAMGEKYSQACPRGV